MSSSRTSARDIKDPEARFWMKVKSSKTDCWEWQAGKSRGYGVFRSELPENLSHRISYMLHFGPIPEGAHIMHMCDNPSCVRPDHLRLGDHDLNMIDATQKGKMNRGANNANAKLTPQKVLLAVELRKHGALMADIARCFGVRNTAIEKVMEGSRWSHVTGIDYKKGQRKIGRPRKIVTRDS